MKTKMIVIGLMVVLAAAVLLTACEKKAAVKAGGVVSNETLNTKPATLVYTCPMHPEVISDKPGKCPKCGMDLVVKK
jgi:hypothetical protein